MLATSCVATGLRMSAQLGRRVAILEDCLAFLNSLAAELQYTLAPMQSIFRRLQEQPQLARLDFIPATAKGCGNGQSFCLSFSQALEASAVLPRQDKPLLAPLAQALGATGLEGQLSAIALAQALTGTALEKARSRRQSHSRLYATTGILCGVAVAIVFL